MWMHILGLKLLEWGVGRGVDCHKPKIGLNSFTGKVDRARNLPVVHVYGQVTVAHPST